MMSHPRLALLMVWVCLWNHTQAISIIGSYTGLEIVNGKARHMHHVTFECDEYDAISGPQPFSLTDVSGFTRNVTVDCGAPEYHYQTQLTGYIPLFQYTVVMGVCPVDTPSNNSMLDTDYKTGAERDNTGLGNLNDYSNGAARRLLSQRIMDDLYDDKVKEQLLKNVPPEKHESYLRDLRERVSSGQVTMLTDHPELEGTWSKGGAKRMFRFFKRRTMKRLNHIRKLMNWNAASTKKTEWSLAGLAALYFGLKYGAAAYSKAFVTGPIKRLWRKNNPPPSGKAPRTEAPRTDLPIDGDAENTMESINVENSALRTSESGAVETTESATKALETGAADEAIEGSVIDGIAGFTAGAGGVLLAAGLAFGLLGNLGGDDSDKWKAVENFEKQVLGEFGKVWGELDADQKWLQKNTEIIQSFQNRFTQQDTINNRLEGEIEANTRALNYVELAQAREADAITTLSGEVNRLYNNAIAGFNESRADFTELANFTVDSFNQIQTNFKELVQQISKITFQQDRIQTDQLHLYRGTNIRRALNRLFHRTNNVDLPQDAAPFVSYAGVPPLNGSAWDALQTMAGGATFGSVIIQRTILSAGDHFGQAFNLTIICNPIEILDRMVPGMNFQILLSQLGPYNCTQGGTSDTDNWICNCGIKIESIECQLKTPLSEHFYPFGAGSNPSADNGKGNGWRGATWMDSVEIGGIAENCQTLPQSPASNGRSDVETGASGYPENVLTSMSEFSDWIQGLCEDSRTVANADGLKVQVHGSYWPRVVNLTLNASAYPDVCSGNFALLTASGGEEALAYSVYRIMTLNYAHSLTDTLRDLESTVYGRLPSGMTYVEEPYHSSAKTQQTYACQWMTYVKISGMEGAVDTNDCTDTYEPGPDCYKVRLYNDLYVGMASKISVTVDGVEITNTSAPAGSLDALQKHIAFPLDTSEVEDQVFMTSRVEVSEVATQLLLGRLFRLGAYPGRVVSGYPMTFDVPFHLFKGTSSANSRLNGVDYIFQPAIWNGTTYNSPFSFREWRAVYGANFDARGVGASAHAFARTLIPPYSYNKDSEQLEQSTAEVEGYVCHQAYNDDGVTLSDSGGNYDWCQLLRFFKAVPIFNESNPHKHDSLIGMRYIPRSFVVTGSLQVPGGTWSQNVLSFCPSSVNITNDTDSGDVTVIFNTSSPEMVTVSVDLWAEDDTCISTTPDYRYSAYTHPPITVSYDPACGEIRYINVKPLASNDYCYAAPGIALDTTRVKFGDNGNRPAEITTAMDEVRDQAYDDIIDQSNQQFLNAIKLWDAIQSAPDTSAFEQKMTAINEERKKLINKMQTDSKRSSALVERKIKAVDEADYKAKQIINQNTNSEYASRQLINEIKKDDMKEQIEINTLKKYAQQARIKNEEEVKARAGFIAAVKGDIATEEEKDSGCDQGGFMGILSAIPCAIGKILSKLKTLFMGLLFAAVVVGIIMCAVQCLPGCIGCIGSMGSKLGSIGSKFRSKKKGYSETSQKEEEEEEREEEEEKREEEEKEKERASRSHFVDHVVHNKAPDNGYHPKAKAKVTPKAKPKPKVEAKTKTKVKGRWARYPDSPTTTTSSSTNLSWFNANADHAGAL